MRAGFSLVELSIVLVILGLLVGGILAGKSLIRASELRSVSNDFMRYKTAVATFRDKYFALPGDMTNATSFWAAADGNDGIGLDCSHLLTAATGTETCNGDGDGSIGILGQTTKQYETHRLWQHLQNAGLMEGKLSGVYTVASNPGYRNAVIGTNVPRARIPNAGFQILYVGSYNTAEASSNHILLGSNFVSGGNSLELMGNAITPEEAWNIDNKMDDGLPLNGALKTAYYNYFGLSFCANSTNTAYALSTTTIQCPLALRLGM